MCGPRNKLKMYTALDVIKVPHPWNRDIKRQRDRERQTERQRER